MCQTEDTSGLPWVTPTIFRHLGGLFNFHSEQTNVYLLRLLIIPKFVHPAPKQAPDRRPSSSTSRDGTPLPGRPVPPLEYEEQPKYAADDVQRGARVRQETIAPAGKQK